MPINLRTLSIALVLAGIISSPAFAAPQANNSSEVLLRGAKNWAAKDRPDLAKNLLQKLILIDPTSQEALFMLGNIELASGKPDEALRHLRALEQAAPNSARAQELGASYRLATSDKSSLEKMRTLARSGKMAEAEALLKQIFPGKPPKGELGVEYYRILGSSKSGFSKAQEELSALYKETGDTRYRLIQLELQSNRSEYLKSAIAGYEELSKNPEVNTQRLQGDWRRSLYKHPDNIDKQSAIRRFLTVYPNDKEMITLLGDVQRNIAGQGAAVKIVKPAATEIKPAKVAAETPKTAIARTTQIAAKAVPRKPQPNKTREPVDSAPALAPETPESPIDPDITARTDALDALDDGNLELAESSLQALLPRRPRDAEVLGGLGMVKLRQGKPAEAEKWFAEALSVADDSGMSKWKSLVETAGFWKNMRAADEFLDANKLPEAEYAAGQALALQPDEPNALALMGNIKVASNDLAGAEKLYRLALQKEGYNVSAIRGLLSLLSRTERQAEALELVEYVNKTYPDELGKNPSVQAGLLREEAELYVAAHRTSHAIQALEMAVVLAPKDPWARFSLAKLYISLDLAPLGRRIMQEGVALAPNDADMRYAAALVLISLDDYAAGLDQLAQIPEGSMSNSMRETRNRAQIQYYFRQAESKLEQGNRKEAIRIMSIAETEARGNYAATEQVAEGWFRLGLQKQGLTAMRKLPQPAPLQTQIYFASLLNRAKKDQELAEYLPGLRIPDGADARSQKFRETIQDIEFSMAGRQFDSLMKAGKKEQAQQLADTVLGANQLSTADYFKFHRTYFYKAELPENAITLLNQEKEQYPNDLSIRWDLANVYYQDKQHDNARRELQELLALTRGDDIDMRLRIAKLQQSLGDNAASRETIDDLIARYPNNTDLLLQAGNLARSQGQYNQAMKYYKLTKEKAQIPSAESPKKTVSAPPSGILLDLLPGKKAEPATAKVIVPASTKESDAIYRAALASGSTQDKPVASNAATYAEQEMASISAQRSARIEAGIDIQTKTATNGTSTYNATEIPVLARFPIGYEAHGTIQVDKVDIDAGALPSTFADAALFGKIQAFQYVPAQPLTPRASGTSVGIGYEQQSTKADVGMTGIGFPVSNVVGGIRHGGEFGRMSYSLNLSRRPYTGSLLSYAGARDPVSGVVWGGVTSTGLSLSLSTTIGEFNFGTTASFGLLRGQNVLNNDRLYLRGSVDTDIYATDDTALNIGLNVNFTNFSKNQAFYTFGHGGYYSPQTSLSFGLPVELTGRQDLLSYLLRLNLSYSRTKEDPAVFYPTDAALQARAAAGPVFPPGNALAIYQGGTGGGFGYGLRGAAEYRLTPNFALGGRLNIERSAYYAPNSILMYLRYMFNPETGPVKMRPDPVTPYSQY